MCGCKRFLQEDGTSIRDRRNGSGFVSLGSTGQLTVITETNGRSAPAYLVAAAERYIELSGSGIPPFELALAAALDEQLGRPYVYASARFG